MIESPNLNTCTAEQWADWYIKNVKQTGGVLLLPNGFYTLEVINKIAKAYRIIGQREGYKKGKRDGSGSTFNHFFRSKCPCQICRHCEICNHEHASQCDVWLKWLGIKPTKSKGANL